MLLIQELFHFSLEIKYGNWYKKVYINQFFKEVLIVFIATTNKQTYYN